MIKYILKKNNVEGSHSFGKWYAFPVKESTVDIDKLAEHMAAHNTPYSAGAIKGIITDMVSCIKELLLEGRSVKLPDLAIFSIGIKNTRGGAVKEEEFTVAANIDGLKLRARHRFAADERPGDQSQTRHRGGGEEEAARHPSEGMTTQKLHSASQLFLFCIFTMKSTVSQRRANDRRAAYIS